jgi:acyl transferase domain-containing protein/acyl carrier protein
MRRRIWGEGRVLGDGRLRPEGILWQLKQLLGKVVKLDPDKIDEREEFLAYGLDSVMIVRLNQMLGEIFGDLSKTLFYEHRNLLSLAGYLVKERGAEFPFDTRPADVRPVGHTDVRPVGDTDVRPVERRMEGVSEPVAIIGLSGRYPMSPSLPDFWENLRSGKDCIAEIPGDRWALEGFFHPDGEKAVELSRSYSKWGGFLDGFAEFDPLFFNISPREAASMDPQERLFLQTCWEVFEDAGYTRERLKARYNGNVGVFAGVTKTGFELYGPGLWEEGRGEFPRTSFSSVANRISYHLNLTGPSMPIDTMCSSSLTAIHEAVGHIRSGACEMAIAGGVNLYLHPLNYIALCAQGFLSRDGRCRSFGSGGTGFVPGEGVGAILLKPLSRAVADKDRIYAVIRGSGVNHGGRTGGYTVPNPLAQAALIRDTLDRAGVHAREVSYLEAHGTGTFLGDPIEVTGITTAFERDTTDRQFCAIGSVKSNIGHLEAAAGIAGVTKILLQMKHGMLAPSLHAADLNVNISFDRTPLFVQRSASEWRRPVVERNGVSVEVPRIAGISSFGAGGSNAHLILEEYPEKNVPVTGGGRSFPALVLLSAMDKITLSEQARRLLPVCGDSKVDLWDIAYTLQTGREAMPERLALAVYSKADLDEKLRAFLGEGGDIGGLYRGSPGGKRIPGEALQLDAWLTAGAYGQILEAWVKGVDVDWERLYRGGDEDHPRRIGLPTYPFAKNRYWLPGTRLSKPANIQWEGLIGQWELEKSRGRSIVMEEVGKSISREELNAMDLSLVERLHEVCFGEDKPGGQGLVRELVRQVLQIELIDDEKSFHDYGLDSMMAMRLSTYLEKKLQHPFKPAWLIEFPTVKELCRHLNRIYPLDLQ